MKFSDSGDQKNKGVREEVSFAKDVGKRGSKTDVIQLDETAFKNKGSKENESLNKIR